MPDYIIVATNFVPRATIGADGSANTQTTTVTISTPQTVADLVDEVLIQASSQFVPGQPVVQPGVATIFEAVSGDVIFSGIVPMQITPESAPVAALAAHVTAAATAA